MSHVIAILCSDLHISQRPPTFRSSEPCWFEAMKRQFDELRFIADFNRAPIICAGDVFDRYCVQPEIINWAIKSVPRMHCIPGQHDLPFHRIEDIRKSAYQTLVEAGTICDLGCERRRLSKDAHALNVYPFPWGQKLVPLEQPEQRCINLAVVHDYIWLNSDTSYNGADESKRSGRYYEALSGYDAAVFGDNHIGFNTTVGGCNVMNCGTFFRRKSDEIRHKPRVGLLCSDGSIILRFLDVSKDVYANASAGNQRAEFVSAGFIEELNSLCPDSLDFRESVKRRMLTLGTDEVVRGMVLNAIK